MTASQGDGSGSPVNPRLELNLNRCGKGSVRLNGHELPFTTAVKVECRAAEPTCVTLEVIAAEVLINAESIKPDAATLRMLTELVETLNADSDERVTVRVEDGPS